MAKVTHIVFAILLSLGTMFSSRAVIADTAVPWSYSGYWGGVPVGYGYIPFPYWYGAGLYNPYGYSYFPFYNYQPYYSTYAAISYSPSSDHFGAAWGHFDQQSAVEASLGFCQQGDCRPVVWVQGGCAALVANTSALRLGWGYGDSLSQASLYAQSACQRGLGQPCQRKVWVCSY